MPSFHHPRSIAGVNATESAAPVALPALAEFVWATRYRAGEKERGIADTWARVAAAAASAEPERTARAQSFLAALRDCRFMPGGRILASAGTARDATLANCFVMGTLTDSVNGICDALKESAVTLQQGGGIGLDFSPLRPSGFAADAIGAIASGPVSFMQVFDGLCAAISATGARRGAMMATLRCDHPDIGAFIAAKRQHTALTHFNLSVLVSDEFVAAVHADADWPLVFPVQSGAPPAAATRATLMRRLAGQAQPVPCHVLRTVRARELWQQLAACAHASAEPGVLFCDTINRHNNLGYREWLAATNPCGEAPLPPYGACHLGSLNLAAFVQEPFTSSARLDVDGLCATAAVAVRFLDNIIDLSRFPLERQAAAAHATRRLGLGISGLGSALAMLGLRYDRQEARDLAADCLRQIRDAAYSASVDLAIERGAFPLFDARQHCARPFIQSLPPDLRARIAAHGIRNSHLLAIAPTGTISLLAGNISSGIEPIFSLSSVRRVGEPEGGVRYLPATEYAYARWRAGRPADAPLPPGFVTSVQVAAIDHLRMQAALQPLVDGAISKTVVLPADATAAQIGDLYLEAHAMQLKGCTVFRTGSRTGVYVEHESLATHCREVDRLAV